MNLQDLGEHDYEPVHGLPEPLPQEERLLWQGAPYWRSLAIRAFHVRKVVIYFTLFGLWRVGSGLGDGLSLGDALASTRGLGMAAVSAVFILGIMAWLYARTTVYTLTNRRVVVRSGVALPITMNIPFKLIESADFKQYADHSGDIPLQLKPSEQTSYIMLWPNVRPWHFSRPQPMLRCVANAKQVADTLAEALLTAHSMDDEKSQAQENSARRTTGSSSSTATA
jgi:hypothetical protein